MDIKVEKADPKVKANFAKRAIQHGPIVYCLEEIDNPDYENAALTGNTTFEGKFLTDPSNRIYSIQTDNGLNYIPYL